MPIRSGRFKYLSFPNTGISIVVGRTGAYYRIFNSADVGTSNTDFNVVVGSNPQTATSTLLKPGFSLDVVVDGRIAINATAGAAIEGIYEYLDSANTEGAGRSGRFNIKTNAANKHKIIDLRIGGQKKKAYYRIFNSGDNPINLFEGDGAASPFAVLNPAQSFDFEVNDSGSKQDIWVNSAANTKPISGIYDFLGT
jgi:hypothetical protein